MSSSSGPRTPTKGKPTSMGASLALPPHLHHFTSPTKASGVKLGSRRDIENSTISQDQTVDLNFATNHLSSLPSVLPGPIDEPLLSRITNPGGTKEVEIYEPLAELLNIISKRAYCKCCSRGIYLFYCCTHTYLCDHSLLDTSPQKNPRIRFSHQLLRSPQQ